MHLHMEKHACVNSDVYLPFLVLVLCGQMSQGVVSSAILLSAEVGVAPCLLQPADLADECLLVRNLRGSYLY